MTTGLKAVPLAALIALWTTAAALADSDDFVTPEPLDSAEASASPHASPGAAAGAMPSGQFRSAMDRVFGPGQWRETSGYRSPGEEDELRREGAGTVQAGHLSRHSMGSPDAPGAYDVVVPGLSTEVAADRLRRSGENFVKVLAEGPHGGQGSHLHVEPGLSLGLPGTLAKVADPPTIYLRIINGRRNALLDR